MSKPTIEYRWEALDPDGTVFKRGPVRNDLSKVKKYAEELVVEISELESPPAVQGRHLAPYWRGAQIRILTRTVGPWTEMEDWEA